MATTMPRSERSIELEREIWGAIGEILHGRDRHEPLVDSTLWTARDHRLYRTAWQKVRLAIEKNAGNAPDEDDPGFERWMTGK